MKWPGEEQESWNYGLEKEGSGRREWKGGMARRRSSRNESQSANYRCRPFLSALFLSITPVMNALCSSVLLHHRGGVTSLRENYIYAEIQHRQNHIT